MKRRVCMRVPSLAGDGNPHRAAALANAEPFRSCSPLRCLLLHPIHARRPNARAAFEIGKIANIESLIRPATQLGAMLLIARNTEAVQTSDIATILTWVP